MLQSEKTGKRVFANYSRMRRLQESIDGVHGICVSCGRVKPIKELQLGHFIHRGRRKFTKLDFSEKNTSPQCVHCNYFNPEGRTFFQKKLEKKYGTGIIDELIALRNTLPMLLDDELEAMNKKFLKKIKELKKNA